MIKKELNPEHGKRLKECIDELGITQKELAEKSGYTKQYISYIVTGKKNMSLESARIFAKILKVDEDYLLCNSDYRTFNDFWSELSSENDMAKNAALKLLKVWGVSISEPFDKKLVGKELDDYISPYREMGIIPLEPHKTLVRVQVNKETPQEINANDIFEFVENIIEFAEFQAEKIKRKLNESKPLSEICDNKDT